METPTTVTEQATLLCPACGKAVVQFQMTPKGVCQFCLSRFEKNQHRWALEPKADQTESHEFAEHHPTETKFFNGDDEEHGTNDGVTHFDFGGLERECREIEPDAMTKAAEGLAAVMQWAFNRCSALEGTRKLVSAMFLLRPQMFNAENMPKLAAELGVTKALVSKHGLKFADAFGLRFRNQRSRTAREHMRLSQLGHAPTNKGQRRNGTTPPKRTNTAA